MAGQRPLDKFGKALLKLSQGSTAPRDGIKYSPLRDPMALPMDDINKRALVQRIAFEKALQEYTLKLQDHERYQGAKHPGVAPVAPRLGDSRTAEQMILDRTGITPDLPFAEVLARLDDINPGNKGDNYAIQGVLGKMKYGVLPIAGMTSTSGTRQFKPSNKAYVMPSSRVRAGALPVQKSPGWRITTMDTPLEMTRILCRPHSAL
jgi:hypothetical protein